MWIGQYQYQLILFEVLKIWGWSWRNRSEQPSIPSVDNGYNWPEFSRTTPLPNKKSEKFSQLSSISTKRTFFKTRSIRICSCPTELRYKSFFLDLYLFGRWIHATFPIPMGHFLRFRKGDRSIARNSSKLARERSSSNPWR